MSSTFRPPIAEQHTSTVTVLMKLIACFVLCAAVAALGCTGESPQQAAVAEQSFGQAVNEQNGTLETVAPVESSGGTGSGEGSTTTSRRNSARENVNDTAAQGGPDETVGSAQPFADCGDLLAHYRATTLQSVLDGSYHSEKDQTTEVPARGGAAAGVTSATGTNLRVADVDEADYVKTDGRHLFLVNYNYLAVFTLREDQPPERTTHIELPTGTGGYSYSELLLASDSALWFRAIGRGFERVTEINYVDLSVPSAPRVLRTLALLHTVYQGAHLVDGQARVILRSTKKTHNDRANLNAWHPTYELIDHGTGERSRGLTVPCSRTYLLTASDVGQSSTSMITIDLSAGLERWGAFRCWATCARCTPRLTSSMSSPIRPAALFRRSTVSQLAAQSRLTRAALPYRGGLTHGRSMNTRDAYGSGSGTQRPTGSRARVEFWSSGRTDGRRVLTREAQVMVVQHCLSVTTSLLVS